MLLKPSENTHENNITLMCTPSHAGISENEKADEKSGLTICDAHYGSGSSLIVISALQLMVIKTRIILIGWEFWRV